MNTGEIINILDSDDENIPTTNSVNESMVVDNNIVLLDSNTDTVQNIQCNAESSNSTNRVKSKIQTLNLL